MEYSEKDLMKFFTRLDITGFCWLWRGKLNDKGYGRTSFKGRSTGAHRKAYELLVGPIPEGLTLDHICRIRHCVNPDHLEPVTQAENTQRAKRFRNLANTYTIDRTPKPPKGPLAHCHKNHVLDEGNTLVSKRPNGTYRLQCKVCQHEAQERYRRKAGIAERRRRGAEAPWGPHHVEYWAQRRAAEALGADLAA